MLDILKLLLIITSSIIFAITLFCCVSVICEYCKDYITTNVIPLFTKNDNTKKDSIDELNKVQDEIFQLKKLKYEITRLNKLQDEVIYLKNPLNKLTDIAILDGKISIDKSELFYSIKVNEINIRDILIDKFSEMLDINFKTPSKLIIRNVKVRLYEITKDCLNDSIESILLLESDKLNFSLDCLNGIDGNKYYRLGHFYTGDDLEAEFFQLDGKHILLTLEINNFSKFIYDE